MQTSIRSVLAILFLTSIGCQKAARNPILAEGNQPIDFAAISAMDVDSATQTAMQRSYMHPAGLMPVRCSVNARSTCWSSITSCPT